MSNLGKQQSVRAMTSATTTTAAALYTRSRLAIHMVLLGKPRPCRATELTAIVSNTADSNLMLITFATNTVVLVDVAAVSLASRLLLNIATATQL